MSAVTVIGGHGKVALLTIPLLVSAGHTVQAVIRKPEQAAAVEAAGAHPVVADLESMPVRDIKALFEDQGPDVIVWAAGAGGGDPQRTYAVDRDAAIRCIEAAEQAGVRRWVMVSYLGSSAQHAVADDDPFYPYAQAKAVADDWLRGSSLDFTLLGPGALTDHEASGRIEVGLTPAEVQVSRGNVARVIAHCVTDPSTVGKAIGFVDGETPITEALAAAPASTDLAPERETASA